MKYDLNLAPINSERWLSLEDFECEEWRDVVGFEGLYLVSNYGRVKTIPHIHKCNDKHGCDMQVVVKEKIKKAVDNGHGYLTVRLSIGNKSKSKYIHRLVAKAFIPNPNSFPQVNHKDENKNNNCVYNLEWCTSHYNNCYGTAKSRMLKTMKENGHIRAIDVYDLNGVFLKTYETAYHIERDGLSRRGVYNVCRGRSRSYKGCVYLFHGEPFRYREKDSYPKGKTKKCNCNKQRWQGYKNI